MRKPIGITGAGHAKAEIGLLKKASFGRWILAGMKSAHTVEDYRKHGNTVDSG